MAEYPNWFASASSLFAMYLAPYKGKPNLKYLQIGVFTGDASVWLLDNILTDPSSSLMDIDTWEGSPDESVHMQMDFEDVFGTYLEKTKPYKNVRYMRAYSADFFFNNQKPDTYDFIYIDGDHTARAVYDDGVGAWACLKPGGIIAFDDYLWGVGLPDQSFAPKPGIDKFLEEHDGQYSILFHGHQVWIQKNA
jgi:hypothetical protein